MFRRSTMGIKDMMKVRVLSGKQGEGDLWIVGEDPFKVLDYGICMTLYHFVVNWVREKSLP
jgi:hypothetical protein